jgi:uncharacterized protein YciI
MIAPLMVGACGSMPDPAPQHAHTFAFLRAGTKRADFSGPALQELMKGHMANIGRLATEGQLYVAGPMGQGNPEPSLRGIFILATGDTSAAEALCQSDPSIAAGVLDAEVVPFLTNRDLRAVLDRGLEFEERRKLDPSISMIDGMTTYALLHVEDGERASRALAPLHASRTILLEGHLGGARSGQRLYFLDVRDLPSATAALAPLQSSLGPHTLFPWFGSSALRPQ